jgi:hypothetical protein
VEAPVAARRAVAAEVRAVGSRRDVGAVLPRAAKVQAAHRLALLAAALQDVDLAAERPDAVDLRASAQLASALCGSFIRVQAHA